MTLFDGNQPGDNRATNLPCPIHAMSFYRMGGNPRTNSRHGGAAR